MSTQLDTGGTNPLFAERQRLRTYWFWFLLFGIGTSIVGLIAISYTFLATVATVQVFGFFLIVGGVFQEANAVLGRSWGAFFVHFLVGLLQMFVVVLAVERPVMTAAIMTLMLADLFVIGGIGRILFAAMHSYT